MLTTRSQAAKSNDESEIAKRKAEDDGKKTRTRKSRSIRCQGRFTTTTASQATARAIEMLRASSSYPLEFNITYKAPTTLCSNDSISGAMREVPLAYFQQHNTSTSTDCPICCCELDSSIVCTSVCNHYFHRSCLEQSLQHGTKCPICRTTITAAPQGKCPNATMQTSLIPNPLTPTADFPNPTHALIQIDYSIRSGTQSSFHDAPGERFHGTHRRAYLDTTVESQWLLQRLRYAFSQGLTFTVGTSLTTGRPHQVTWASIHHKTNLGVGVPFALPDPGYSVNCNEELDALHVPTGPECLEAFQSSHDGSAPSSDVGLDSSQDDFGGRSTLFPARSGV